MHPGYGDREIAEDPAERAPPPDDVFSFSLGETWRDRTWRMLEDVVTDDVKAEFVRSPPEYVVSDDLSWLDEIILSVTGVASDTKELVAERLAGGYRAFRAAHATRTDNLAQFYEYGLRCLRADDVEARARRIFLDAGLQGVTEERLPAAIADVRAIRQEGVRDAYTSARTSAA